MKTLKQIFDNLYIQRTIIPQARAHTAKAMLNYRNKTQEDRDAWQKSRDEAILAHRQKWVDMDNLVSRRTRDIWEDGNFEDQYEPQSYEEEMVYNRSKLAMVNEMFCHLQDPEDYPDTHKEHNELWMWRMETVLDDEWTSSELEDFLGYDCNSSDYEYDTSRLEDHSTSTAHTTHTTKITNEHGEELGRVVATTCDQNGCV